ncbi:MAG: terminase family protein [Pseudomonadota bacterium]
MAPEEIVDAALVADIARLSREDQWSVLAKLTERQRRELSQRWTAWALPAQRDPGGDPAVWLILAGRGFGKTRAGAEWLSEQARRMPDGRFALVGATAADAQRVMIEGRSGLLSVARTGEPVRWRRERGEVEFASGAVAHVYSAAAPEALRGPEHHIAWCDEIGKWRRAEAWDNLMMGLRLGDRPRALVTTTPRSTALMRRVEALAVSSGAVTRGATRDNPHLPASFVAAITQQYAGSRLGRQELDGVLVEDIEGALWTRATLDACRVKRRPALVRVVVAVDPPASQGGDACGIVAAGLAADGRGYVIEDASIAGASPEGWAAAVAACFARHKADRVVAEKNQGGDMVRSVLIAADRRLPIRLVHASRGKTVRAEPVAALYESRRVRHVGAFPALEDELCGLVAGGDYEGPGRSPDRADALVWALTELMLGRQASATVRAI